MLVPVPTSTTVGQLLASSFWNTQVAAPITFLVNPPLFVGRLTVATSLATATNIAVPWDTEDLDTDNGHSTGTNTSRYTAATAGWYQVDTTVWFDTNATGTRTLKLFVNGGLIAGSPSANGNALSAGVTILSAATTFYLNGTTDYFEAYVVSTTVPLNLTSGRVALRWVHA